MTEPQGNSPDGWRVMDGELFGSVSAVTGEDEPLSDEDFAEMIAALREVGHIPSN